MAKSKEELAIYIWQLLDQQDYVGEYDGVNSVEIEGYFDLEDIAEEIITFLAEPQ